MAISIGSIPYGMSVNSKMTPYESTKTIVSDGRVDDAFVSQDASFVSYIQDPRVQAYTATGEAPTADWKEDKDFGGFSHGTQNVCIEDGSVVLRTTIQDKGSRVTHKISAPYDIESGKVDVEGSYEGFKIASQPGTGTARFSIPL